MFFSPWTLDISAHIINTSYAIVGAIVFVVCAFELVPALRVGAVPRNLAFFGLGFGLLWVAQFHLSVAILAPLAVAVCGFAAWENPRRALVGLAWCGIGAVLAGLTIIPTLLADGLGAVAGRTGENIVFEPSNVMRLPQIVLQCLSLATFEVARFVGPSTHDRLAFLARFPWAAPAVIVAGVLGTIQVAVLLIELCRAHPERKGWAPVRHTMLAILALLVASFAFSVRAPASHAYYVLLPVVMIYAFYVWADCSGSSGSVRWRSCSSSLERSPTSRSAFETSRTAPCTRAGMSSFAQSRSGTIACLVNGGPSRGPWSGGGSRYRRSWPKARGSGLKATPEWRGRLSAFLEATANSRSVSRGGQAGRATLGA